MLCYEGQQMHHSTTTSNAVAYSIANTTSNAVANTTSNAVAYSIANTIYNAVADANASVRKKRACEQPHVCGMPI
jgi:hypothetical protein